MDIARILFFIIAFCILTMFSIGTSKIFSYAIRLPHGLEKTLGFVGVLFPLFFVAAFIIGNYYSNGIARFFYTIVVTLGGMYFYFLLGAVLLAIFYFINSLGVTLPMQSIAVVLAALSFIAGIIGIVQAKIPRVTTYTINADIFPTWKGKKMVLIADTHFGLVNQTKLAEKTLNQIKAINPDAVVIPGDFFDGPSFNLESIKPAITELGTTYKTFYAPGNHEEFGKYATFIQFLKDAHITVLEDEATSYDGVTIAGFLYRQKSRASQLDEVFKKLAINPNEKILAINHYPGLYDIFLKNGVDMIVSGHSHRGQFWPLNYLTYAIYGKYHYGHHTFQTLETVTTNGVGTSGPPLRLFNRPEIVVLQFN